MNISDDAGAWDAIDADQQRQLTAPCIISLIEATKARIVVYAYMSPDLAQATNGRVHVTPGHMGRIGKLLGATPIGIPTTHIPRPPTPP